MTEIGLFETKSGIVAISSGLCGGLGESPTQLDVRLFPEVNSASTFCRSAAACFFGSHANKHTTHIKMNGRTSVFATMPDLA